MAKFWIVPSSLFVPGRIMAPARIQEDQRALRKRQRRLTAELEAIPRRLAEMDQELALLDGEYGPYNPWSAHE